METLSRYTTLSIHYVGSLDIWMNVWKVVVKLVRPSYIEPFADILFGTGPSQS